MVISENYKCTLSAGQKCLHVTANEHLKLPCEKKHLWDTWNQGVCVVSSQEFSLFSEGDLGFYAIVGRIQKKKYFGKY